MNKKRIFENLLSRKKIKVSYDVRITGKIMIVEIMDLRLFTS